MYDPVKYYQEIEAPCAKIFAEMSNRGIVINLQHLNSVKIALEQQLKPLEDQIKNELGDIF